jgi:hypothetical protein
MGWLIGVGQWFPLQCLWRAKLPPLYFAIQSNSRFRLEIPPI